MLIINNKLWYIKGEGLRIGRFELYYDWWFRAREIRVLNKNKLTLLPYFSLGKSANSYRRFLWNGWNLLIYRKYPNNFDRKKYYETK